MRPIPAIDRLVGWMGVSSFHSSLNNSVSMSLSLRFTSI